MADSFLYHGDHHTADLITNRFLMMKIKEGSPFHTRGMLPEFVRRFQQIEKPEIAERMLKGYGKNTAYNL